jgi:hypothetical protein
LAVIVLDSGAVTAFAGADRVMRERIRRLAARSGEAFVVPLAVLIESTTGNAGRDAVVNRFLSGCELAPLTELVARRSAALRFAAHAGSAVDAVVVATTEARGGGVALTGDIGDLSALAAAARGVRVLPIP